MLTVDPANSHGLPEDDKQNGGSCRKRVPQCQHVYACLQSNNATSTSQYIVGHIVHQPIMLPSRMDRADHMHSRVLSKLRTMFLDNIPPV